MGRTCSATTLLILMTAGTANAYEFRVRFVERVGSIDVELAGGDRLDTFVGRESRIRVQFGVFDDGAGPALAGGYVGWNLGAITVNARASGSDEYRNSSTGVHNGVGRLSPFNFAAASGGANGLPAGDPFEALTAIDNTLGQQSLPWFFGEPAPQPIIRGLNTWVSTFELSVVPREFADYTIDFGGNLIAAQEWRGVGEILEPTPDKPGLVTYAPFVDPPREFSASLHVIVTPNPAAASLFALAGALLPRRRPRVH